MRLAGSSEQVTAARSGRRLEWLTKRGSNYKFLDLHVNEHTQ